MRTVSIRDAKTHLSKLVGAVESGAVDEVVIARDGKTSRQTGTHRQDRTDR